MARELAMPGALVEFCNVDAARAQAVIDRLGRDGAGVLLGAAGAAFDFSARRWVSVRTPVPAPEPPEPVAVLRWSDYEEAIRFLQRSFCRADSYNAHSAMEILERAERRT